MCFVYRTIFISLYDGLVTLFPSLWVGQNHLETDIGVGWQVSHQVTWCWGEKANKKRTSIVKKILYNICNEFRAAQLTKYSYVLLRTTANPTGNQHPKVITVKYFNTYMSCPPDTS